MTRFCCFKVKKNINIPFNTDRKCSIFRLLVKLITNEQFRNSHISKPRRQYQS